MSLDPQLWSQLEAHGLSQEHLTLLLSLLQLQKNGSVAWHFAHGTLVHNDIRIVFSNRSYDMQRVGEALLDGNSLLK